MECFIVRTSHDTLLINSEVNCTKWIFMIFLILSFLFKHWKFHILFNSVLFTKNTSRNVTSEPIKASGFDKYYIDHTLAIWPQAASGEPFSASQLQSTGDTITDLYEDMAAEQKARLTYDNILRIVKDPEVAEPIRFLREREIVHFQRFGECLRRTQENLDCRNFYAFNQQIDKKNCGK